MGSNIQLESLEDCLEKHLPEKELKEVKGILYGKELEYVYPFLLCGVNFSHYRIGHSFCSCFRREVFFLTHELSLTHIPFGFIIIPVLYYCLTYLRCSHFCHSLVFVYHQQRRPITFSKEVLEFADQNNFEIKGYVFEAEKEQLRPERKVRLGLIQHSIALPTTASVEAQRDAILKKVETILSAASQSGVNVVCFQEAWSESSCLLLLFLGITL